MVCDLCKKIIPEGTHPMDTASLSHGYIAHRVTERTKRVWFRWPDLSRPGGRYDAERERKAREMRVEYDFHAECIYALVKEAVEGGRTERGKP